MQQLKTGPWNLIDLKDIPKNGKKVFSIFHCGGGSTMGYKLSGYDVLGGVEIDPEMMAIYRANHNPKHSYLMSITKFNKLPREEIPKELFELDILDGSPPCSSFSMAGSREKKWGEKKKFREGQAEQILDDLFFHFIETARILQPKVVVAENVKGLIIGKAKGYVKQIFQMFNLAGYGTQLFLLNAAFMGVPQRRERTFFIARRKDLNLPKIELNFNEKPIGFYDSIIDLKNQKGKSVPSSLIGAGRWMSQNKSDEVVEWAKEIKGKEKFFTIKGTILEQPIKTLTSSSRHIFYNSDRFMSDMECIRVQSFPDDYNFLNSDPGYVCGMSVPPYMMNRISDQIYKQWLVNNG